MQRMPHVGGAAAAVRINVRAAVARLVAAGLDPAEARVSARVLREEAERAGGRGGVAAARRYDQSLARRGEGREPLQYIVGTWPWGGVELAVRPPVLVPRPETEELVDVVARIVLARAAAAGEGSGPPCASGQLGWPSTLLDVGTGSGAIAIACATRLPSLTSCVALDVSPHAVALARSNASSCGVARRVAVVHAPFEAYDPPCRVGILVSNPPYLPVMPTQPEVALWEDPAALLGGEPEGCGVVLSLLHHAPRLVVGGGHVVLEVHESHPRALHALLTHEDGEEHPAGTLTLLPAGGWGKPRVDVHDGPLPRWVGQVAPATRATLRASLAWDAAFYDCFGRPRFVSLRVNFTPLKTPRSIPLRGGTAERNVLRAA